MAEAEPPTLSSLHERPSLPSCAFSWSGPEMTASYSHTSYAVRAPPTVPTTFLRFQQLPAELRIKIWNEALPAPRTIHLVREIYYDLHSTDLRPTARNTRCTATLPCPLAISSLLETCTESRHEVLSRYVALLTPRLKTDSPLDTHYFDPLQDGIFIDRIWPWIRGGVNKPSGVFKTRRLSISCNEWWDFWTCNSPQLFGKGGLLRFKHLEQLHIVCRVKNDAEMLVYPSRPPIRYGPNHISFPRLDVNIELEPIIEKFAVMKKENPDWNVPQVKLMAWAVKS